MLTGGASARMGSDKARLEVDGVAMAVRVATALAAGGARPVIAVGGDTSALRALGLEVVPDADPGAGPLAAIATALREARRRAAATAVVAGCDHPWLAGPTVASLHAALQARPDAAVAAAESLGQPPLVLALRVGAATAVVDELLATGRRSVGALLDAVPTVRVGGLAAGTLRDVDRPADLDGG